MVTGGDDGVARVWQVKPTRQLVTVLRGHTEASAERGSARTGRRSPPSRTTAAGELWPARLAHASRSSGWQSAESTAFSPNSRDVLVVRRRGNAWADAVWNAGAGDRAVERRRFLRLPDPATWPCGRAAGCSPWSPNGRFVAGVNAAGDAVIWDASTAQGAAHRKANRDRDRSCVQPGRPPPGRRVRGSAAARGSGTSRPASPGRWCRPCGGRRLSFSAQFVPNSPWVLTVDSVRCTRSSPIRRRARLRLLSGHVLPAGVAAAGNGQRIALASAQGERP